MAEWDDARRREAFERGHAMAPLRPGGEPRFPIEDRDDVHNALTDYNRIPDTEKPGVRRHITRRAVEIGAADELPDDWHIVTEKEI